VIGTYVRLEGIQVDRHLPALYQQTSGCAMHENQSYDPQRIWSFQPDGPFDTMEQLQQSFVFHHLPNQAAFAMIDTITDRVMGVIMLSNDDPNHLTIQLEAPIIPPYLDGTPVQLEACYLLLDRLFALGYRRIQYSIDAQDVEKRHLASRLGFTLEGILYKQMIVKDANRDSGIYGLINSDWKNGARNALYRKLYGTKLLRLDQGNEKQEQELDEQNRLLAEQRQMEKLLSTMNNVEKEEEVKIKKN
jgi:RimJ/RimL family protein N-acetyltransferase